MIASSFFLAASSLLPLALGAPVTSLVGRGATNYQVFGGDGTMVQGWPSSSQWLKFEQLWAINLPTLHASCQQYPGKPADNSQGEIDLIYAALDTVAAESGLDKRFLLVIMMQESKGCVRAPTTNYGYNNPGLMQSFQGRGTCNPDNVNFKNPCPKSDIEQMIRDGAGIGLEFGLTQAISQTGASDDSKYYKGARTYNSGSVHASGNLGAGIATHCYASDIANRLVGWPDDRDHHSACSEQAIQTAQGSATAYAGAIVDESPSPAPAQGNQPTTPVVPNKQVQPAPAPGKPETTPTTTAPTGNKIAGAAANCKSWYTVKAGDSCASTGIEFATLRKLNPSLDATCSNLWLGYSYCTAA